MDYNLILGFFGVLLFLPVLRIAYWVVSRKQIFPYVYLLIFSLEYLSPKGVITITKVLSFILVVVYLYANMHNLSLRTYRLFKPLLFFSIYFIFSILWTPDLSFSVERAFSFILLLISFWFVAHFTQDEKGLQHFIGAFVFISILISFTAIINFLMNYGNESFTRTGAFNDHAIHTSFIILLGTIPITIAFLFRRKRMWKWLSPKLYPFAIILNIIGVLSTASKTPIVLFIFSFGIIFMFFSERGLYIRKKLIALGVIGVVLIFLINPYIAILDNIRSRATYEVLTYGNQQGLLNKYMHGRVLIAEYAWENFTENPIFGVGLEGFKDNLIVTPYSMFHTSTHNSLLWALAEGGVVGLILFLIVILTSLLTSIRSARFAVYTKNLLSKVNALSLLLMIIIVLLSSFSFNIEFNKFFWVILALIESQWGLSKLKIYHCKTAKLSN